MADKRKQKGGNGGTGTEEEIDGHTVRIQMGFVVNERSRPSCREARDGPRTHKRWSMACVRGRVISTSETAVSSKADPATSSADAWLAGVIDGLSKIQGAREQACAAEPARRTRSFNFAATSDQWHEALRLLNILSPCWRNPASNPQTTGFSTNTEHFSEWWFVRVGLETFLAAARTHVSGVLRAGAENCER